MPCAKAGSAHRDESATSATAIRELRCTAPLTKLLQLRNSLIAFGLGTGAGAQRRAAVAAAKGGSRWKRRRLARGQSLLRHQVNRAFNRDVHDPGFLVGPAIAVQLLFDGGTELVQVGDRIGLQLRRGKALRRFALREAGGRND